MKKTMTVLLCALIGCVGCLDAPPDTDTAEQAICNPNPDTCPGGHPITPKQYTINDLKRWGRNRGFYVSPTPVASCNAISCSASVGTGTQQFNTTCFDFTAVAWCEHQECNVVDQDEDSTGWECHDVPPLG
jgi:hypothetical protein